ncbi:uncharacterized protein TM35_000121930 [Trypanosoma theileri]|uniref:Transmembrane protein n=1 Tax=Trypanosoma theileri TaxID=67003 RepID=A0A1X0NXY6_9TRYP|nr:uncharacterized protein TM35_000121930 [Trypanosoma theileri]ORC89418.1 hypothetical protein TM35_000121930 [Trypanosoma theileri]
MHLRKFQDGEGMPAKKHPNHLQGKTAKTKETTSTSSTFNEQPPACGQTFPQVEEAFRHTYAGPFGARRPKAERKEIPPHQRSRTAYHQLRAWFAVVSSPLGFAFGAVYFGRGVEPHRTPPPREATPHQNMRRAGFRGTPRDRTRGLSPESQTNNKINRLLLFCFLCQVTKRMIEPYVLGGMSCTGVFLTFRGNFYFFLFQRASQFVSF